MTKKEKGGIKASGVLRRFQKLRRGQGSEPVTDFCVRCGLDASAWSRWRQKGAVISADSIRQVFEANRKENPWLTLEWLFYGTNPTDEEYRLVEKMAGEVLDAVNRTLELVPDSSAGTVRLVRQDVPTGNTPRRDTK